MRRSVRPFTPRLQEACVRLVRNGLLPLLALVSLQLVAGCGRSSSSALPGPSLTITSLGWAEESIDPSYWTTAPPNGQTAFYDFWIHYSGDIAYSDIQYARVYLPGGSYWNIATRPQLFDGTKRVIGGWNRWYSTQTNFLPIGSLQVEVKLTDGTDAQFTAFIPAPGSTTAGTYTTMHSEDAISPPPWSAPMLPRATLGPTQTLTAATQTLSVTFSAVDPNVHDGYVWFFDASGAFVGEFMYLVDPSTGLASPRLAGSTLYNDGTMNTLTVSASDLHFVTGGSFGQIARFRVVLTDGAQYGLVASGALRYDCVSISAEAPLTLQ
jgi:hypothetical protein